MYPANDGGGIGIEDLSIRFHVVTHTTTQTLLYPCVCVTHRGVESAALDKNRLRNVRDHDDFLLCNVLDPVIECLDSNSVLQLTVVELNLSAERIVAWVLDFYDGITGVI